jgi:hypothetical protein
MSSCLEIFFRLTEHYDHKKPTADSAGKELDQKGVS